MSSEATKIGYDNINKRQQYVVFNREGNTGAAFPLRTSLLPDNRYGIPRRDRGTKTGILIPLFASGSKKISTYKIMDFLKYLKQVFFLKNDRNKKLNPLKRIVLRRKIRIK